MSHGRLLADNARLKKLLGSVVRSIGRHKRKFKPVWVTVMDYFGLGSTSAQALCLEFGIDPESGKKIKAHPPAALAREQGGRA